MQPPCREPTARGVGTTRLRIGNGLCTCAKQRMRRIAERTGRSLSRVFRRKSVKACSGPHQWSQVVTALWLRGITSGFAQVLRQGMGNTAPSRRFLEGCGWEKRGKCLKNGRVLRNQGVRW